MRMKLAGLAGLAVLLTSTSALAADEFGLQGEFIFSADRLFGFYGYSASSKITWAPGTGHGPNGGDYEDSQSGTQLNFLWGNAGTGAGYPGLSVNPFVIPRLSFDYSVIDHLTIGGSIGFATTSGTQREDRRPQGVALGAPNDLPDTNAFLISPRIGYAIMFTRVIGLWPRGGFSYSRLHAEWTNPPAPDRFETSAWLLDLDFEALLVISPAPHFAFTLGPIVDLGLTGGSSYKQSPPPQFPQPNGSVRMHNYGLAFGLLGYFP